MRPSLALTSRWLIPKTGTTSAHAVWQRLHEIQEHALAQYLVKEHPQVIALVLSRAESATSARLLKTLPRPLSQEIVERMLSLKPVSERPLALLEISFLQDLLLNGRRDADVSPHTRMAQIINKMDRKVMDECLQFFGGYGYMMEYPIAKLYTNARIQKIYGGTNEIMKMLVARTL